MKIAIIGAGASGMTCAISAALTAKKNNISADITIFESKDKPGRKILATGNGRCNLMNENEGDYFFDKKGFSSYALKRFDVKSNLAFFSEMGLYTCSDSEGRIYPLSNQASSVLDALRFECERLGVNFVCSREIKEIKHCGKDFCVDGLLFDNVVLACGGKASVREHNGYALLRSLGHKTTEISPSLTKINVKDKKFVRQLKGVRQKGVFYLCEGNRTIATEKGELLFADYGISGIAVMQLSAYVTRYGKNGNFKVVADFAEEFSFNELSEAIKRLIEHDPGRKLENLLSGIIPKKTGEAIIKSLGYNLSDSISVLNGKDIKNISSALKKNVFEVESLRGFDDAQVTAGGADTDMFDPHTMQSKKIKGLYCIGELLDVDGLCGGYNLHWAWSSGRLCGESIFKEKTNRKG